MAATKVIHFTAPEYNGLSLYVKVRSFASTDAYLNSVGGFSTDPDAAASVPMTEDPAAPGVFVLKESRTAWPNGPYIVSYWRRIGEAPTLSDELLGTAILQVFNDAIVGVS